MVNWQNYVPNNLQETFGPPATIHKQAIPVCSSIFSVLGFSLPPPPVSRTSRYTVKLQETKVQMEAAKKEYDQLEGGYDNPGPKVCIVEALNQ